MPFSCSVISSAREKSFFVCGQISAVRRGDHGKHRSPHIGEANLRPFGRIIPEEGGRMPSSCISISSERAALLPALRLAF